MVQHIEGDLSPVTNPLHLKMLLLHEKRQLRAIFQSKLQEKPPSACVHFRLPLKLGRKA